MSDNKAMIVLETATRKKLIAIIEGQKSTINEQEILLLAYEAEAFADTEQTTLERFLAQESEARFHRESEEMDEIIEEGYEDWLD